MLLSTLATDHAKENNKTGSISKLCHITNADSFVAQGNIKNLEKRKLENMENMAGTASGQYTVHVNPPYTV